MPKIVELPGNRTVEFPDDFTEDRMNVEILHAFPDLARGGVLEPSVPKPGESAAGKIGTPLTAFEAGQIPTMAQQAKESPIPELSAGEIGQAAIETFTQPLVELPVVGEEGSRIRGARQAVSNLVGAMTSPVGLGLSAAIGAAPAIGKVAGPLFGAAGVKSGMQKMGEAGVTGDKEKWWEGFTESLLGAAAFGGETPKAIRERRSVLTQKLRAVDAAAREALAITPEKITTVEMPPPQFTMEAVGAGARRAFLPKARELVSTEAEDVFGLGKLTEASNAEIAAATEILRTDAPLTAAELEKDVPEPKVETQAPATPEPAPAQDLNAAVGRQVVVPHQLTPSSPVVDRTVTVTSVSEGASRSGKKQIWFHFDDGNDIGVQVEFGTGEKPLTYEEAFEQAVNRRNGKLPPKPAPAPTPPAKVETPTVTPLFGGMFELTEPPVPPGYIRLYRGEPGKPPTWSERVGKVVAPEELRGRWFTPDKSYALYYASDASGKFPEGASLKYIDVPEGTQLTQWYPKGSLGKNEVPGKELILPETEAHRIQTAPIKNVESPISREPWQMTYKEYTKGQKEGPGSYFNESAARQSHRAYVEQSLAQGKPVPPEVLADYPDLAPKPEAKEPVLVLSSLEKPDMPRPQELDAIGVAMSPDGKRFVEAGEPLPETVEPYAGGKGMVEGEAGSGKRLYTTNSEDGKLHQVLILKLQGTYDGKPKWTFVWTEGPSKGEFSTTYSHSFWDIAKKESPEVAPKPEAKPTGETAPVAAAAKVEQQVKAVAKTEGQRSAKEVKSELVQRLEQAIKDAPSEGEVRATSYTKADMQRVEVPDRAEMVTIDIPGDGTFKIRNTKEALEGILKRAKRISTESMASKATFPKGAVQSSEKALRKIEEAKEKQRVKGLEDLKSKARVQMHDALNKSPEEGIVGHTRTEEDPAIDGGTLFKEYRLRKTTPQEQADFWKSDRREVRWIGEMRVVRFDPTKGRTENEWGYASSGKTYADAMRQMVGDAMPANAVFQNEGAQAWHDLEYETGKFAFLSKEPKSPETPPTGPSVPTPAEQAEIRAELDDTLGGRTGVPLTPLPPGAGNVPVKGLHDIIKDLAKGLKLPIRFGRLTTTKFGGYFKPIADLIGSRRANALPEISHEVGHKLDKHLKFSSDRSIAGELDVLGDPATPGSISSWTKSKSRAYKLGEGVGEFVRYWLTDPPEAMAKAPRTYAAFETAMNANPDFGDVMRTAQADIQIWRAAPSQSRLRSHISIGDNPNKTPYRLRQLTRDLVDDLHILRVAVDDAQRWLGSKLAPMKNPYVLARLLRGAYGRADVFVRHGTVDFKTKAVTLGNSLQDALKPIAGRIDEFRDYIVARRAKEIHSQGRNSGLLDQDIQVTVQRYANDTAFQRAFDAVKEWQDSLVTYARDAGLISDEGLIAMRRMNQDYVPFHRLFEIGAGEISSLESPGLGRGLNLGKPSSLRGLHGSPRPIVDPLETMIKNAYVLTTAAEKQAIHLALADLSSSPGMGKWVEKIATPKEMVKVGIEKIRKQLEDAGADLTGVPDDLLLSFFQNSRQAPFGENIIRIVRNGKPEFYRLDRELFDTFHALDLDDAGQLTKILAAPAQLLRSGVILAPDFALANAFRDAFSSAIVGRYTTFPFETTIRGLAAMLRRPKLVQEWKAAGGANAVEASYFDRTRMQKFMRESITSDLTPMEKAVLIAKGPLTFLRWLTGTAEEATRIGEYDLAYKALRKGGMSEGDARTMAGFESRDRQDFAKGGAKTKILRLWTPFWNAGLQANVKLAQSFRERPFQTTVKGLAFITTAKVIEQALNWDDEDYWDRPQWERDTFFMIPIGKDQAGKTRFLKLPTPFEPGIIFGTLPGRVFQYLRQNDKRAIDGFMQAVAQQTIPNPIPQGIQVIFEDFLSGSKGWDIFRGRQIVPESIADMPTDLQWTEQTSLTARKVGKLIGLSPMKVDHIIASTSGGLGRQLTHNVSDRLIQLTTGEKPTATSQVPGGRFITVPGGIVSQSVEDFYTYFQKIAAEENRWKASGKGKEWAGLATDFRSAAKQMSNLRAASRSTTDPLEKQKYAIQIAEIAKIYAAEARKMGVK